MSTTQTINSYEQSIELIERFAECLLKDHKNQNDLASLKQCATYIAYFSNEIEMTKTRNQIYEEFIEKINSATEKPDCGIVLQKFNEEIDRASKNLKSGEKSKKYINFMKKISEQNVDDDNDEEIKTISETVNTIDPISKLPIVEPVKNKICGHTYEKTTILQLLEQNPKTKCPIPGCNASDFVKKSHLVPDNALKRILTNTTFNSKKLKVHE